MGFSYTVCTQLVCFSQTFLEFYIFQRVSIFFKISLFLPVSIAPQ